MANIWIFWLDISRMGQVMMYQRKVIDTASNMNSALTMLQKHTPRGYYSSDILAEWQGAGFPFDTYREQHRWRA